MTIRRLPRTLGRFALAAVLVLLLDVHAVAAAPRPSLRNLQPLSQNPELADCAWASLYGTTTDESEPTLAVDPVDDRRMAVAWMQGGKGGAFGMVVASTTDGGRTWRRSVAPITDCALGEFASTSDPWLSFGADGVLYLSAIRASVAGPPDETVVVRSDDGGQTWRTPVVVTESGEMPRVEADRHHAGHVALIWYDNPTIVGALGTAVRFASSTDGGATWTTPVDVVRPLDATSVGQATVRLLPDGSLVATWLRIADDRSSDLEQSARSTDGGQTWSAPTTLAATSSRFPVDPYGDNEQKGLDDAPTWMGDDIGSYPSPSLSVAADGTAYVAWNDIANPATSTYSSRVFMTRSSDGGATWTPPRAIVDEPTQAYLAVIAGGHDGSVALTYYDLRNDAPGDARLTVDVWLTRSSDHGLTWSELHLAGPFDGRDLKAADYTGLAPTGSGYATAFELGPVTPEPPRDIWFARADDLFGARDTL